MRRISRASSSGVPRIKKLAEDVRCALFRRKANAATIPRRAASADDQRREPRLPAEVRGDFLIQRDAVADVAGANAVGVNAGHQPDFGVVPAAVAVRHAGKHRNVITQWLTAALQIAARLVILPGLFRKEVRRIHAAAVGPPEVAASAQASWLPPRASGRIASRNGSPIATPDARRKVRRCSGLQRHGYLRVL